MNEAKCACAKNVYSNFVMAIAVQNNIDNDIVSDISNGYFLHAWYIDKFLQLISDQPERHSYSIMGPH